MFAIRYSRQAACACLLFLAHSPTAVAENPAIVFDFGRTAECRDVTSELPEDVYPGEKIIELTLRVSVHLVTGDIDDVDEIRIELGDCDERMRVHSFEPNTRLESRLSGDIQWTKTTETGHSLGGSLGGQLPVALGDTVAHVTPSIDGGLKQREVVTETQTRVAPKEAIVASGTISHEHGVFFKLRASPHTSLEGVHELTVRFVVPESWRGDSLRVCCQATGEEKLLWLKRQATWAHVCIPVALYAAGDQQARQAAERYADRADRS